jgi:hypothetical protein
MTFSKTQITRARTLTALATAGTLLVAPAAGLAKRPHEPGKGKAKRAAACAKAHSKAFAVAGTLVSATLDDPATAASEATVTLKLTAANRHARRSGDIADQNPAKRGVQPRGFVYTVPAGDAYRLHLRGYQGADTPSPGDRVAVRGRIAVTKPRCAAPGTSVADRYGAIDVRRVAIGDRDPD